MYNYDRSYRLARIIYTIKELVGWLAVVSGILLIVAGFTSAGLFGMVNAPLWAARFIAAVPGLLVVYVGISGIVDVQSKRVSIDTAEATREMLEIARREERRGNGPALSPERAPSEAANFVRERV